jgi:hypothetical protein
MSKQPLFIITGLPRSGTTRLAAYCQMMGQPLQGLWMPEVWDGGLEDGDVMKINKAMVENGRSAELDATIRGFPRPILKEPRFVTLERPIVIETWFELHPDLRLLIMRRDYVQAGRSLHNSKRIKGFGKDPNEAAAILQRQYELFMQTVRRLAIPHAELEHPSNGVSQLLVVSDGCGSRLPRMAGASACSLTRCC